jgi:hypothetical protein
MFIYSKTKQISTIIQDEALRIISQLNIIFKDSIAGCGREVDFLYILTNKLEDYFNNRCNIPNLFMSCKAKVIHQKPIVLFNNKRCELGDLLIVVNYILEPDIYETKSIIYQVKLSKKPTSLVYEINQKQLELLCDWPSFSFGNKIDGNEQKFNISPKSLEFGSFMFEPRSAFLGSHVWGKYLCYGICPHARLVRLKGGRTVRIDSFFYTRGDADNFFSHLAFEIGEHHCNQEVKDLIDALYRHIEFATDPPHEFDGYWIEKKDDGFAVIEINIKSELKE